MLKWTVGQKKACGTKKTPSGPCYSIRRAAAKLSRRSGDKENSGGSGLSPRTRDSVYMRLDALPAALRDVSNHYQTQVTPTASPRISATQSTGVKRTRSRSRKARTPRASRVCDLARDGQFASTPRKRHRRRSTSDCLLAATTPHVAPAVDTRPIHTLISTRPSRPIKSPVTVEYSPCPLRPSTSLLSMRRRLTDVFIQTHHSLGNLERHDKPISFTYQKPRPSASATSATLSALQTSHSNVKRTQVEISLSNDIVSPKLTRCVHSNDSPITGRVSCGNISLSPLSRHLAALRLSNVSNSSIPLRTASFSPIFPSPVTLTNSVPTQHHLGFAHDNTDPRFLSLFAPVEGNPSPVFAGMSSDMPSEVRVTGNGMDGDISRTSELRKRNSLRRTRTLTCTIEEGPPVKMQQVELSNDSSVVPTLAFSPITSDPKRDVLNLRPRKSFRRKSRRSSSKGLGDGIYTKENPICDSIFNGQGAANWSSDSLDQQEFTLKRQGGFRRRNRPFMVSDENLALTKVTKNGYNSCLTLPDGIPSPYTPQVTTSSCQRLEAELPSTSGARPCRSLEEQRPSPNNIGVFSVNRNISSCRSAVDISQRFGLTLSKGIPSPPSPSGDSKDTSAVMEGVQPLAMSPPPPAQNSSRRSNDADISAIFSWVDGVATGRAEASNLSDEAKTKAFACRRVMVNSSDDAGASSSDETWNSHSLNLMKTPRLTGHILKDDLGLDAATASPLALVERRSRSRRCLLFVTPGGSTRQKYKQSAPASKVSKDWVPGKGELELAIYGNSGLLTVHVVRGRNLHKVGARSCNAYVKVTLVPSSEERTFHRTAVHRDSNAPRFDQKFSFEVLESDLEKRILVSAWHRDKNLRRSEFLGCMSFAVKHAVKKDISGSFCLLSQSSGSGRTKAVPAPEARLPVRARQSDCSSVEEVQSFNSDVPPTPQPAMERQNSSSKKKPEKSTTDDSSFLRFLELETEDETSGLNLAAKGGRTPFTTTRRLTRRGGTGFGFSIAWTQPPRVERVEAGLPADRAGLRPGDFVVFVEKLNVVTLPEEEILNLIRSCGNQLILEVYRKSGPNGVVPESNPTPAPSPAPPRSSTTCSATTSLDLSKRRLHLPQVTFSSEAEPLSREDARRRAVYQLLNKEQHYAFNLQFGLSRFLMPLSERKDLMSPTEHLTLFQNVEELLRLTEDTLEQLIQEDGEPFGTALGRVYLKKIAVMAAAYRRYFSGLKKSDCLLAAKTRNTEFMRAIVEPVVPRRRPDLTAFIHKPLEHYRERLKLLQTILNLSKVAEEDYPALARVVHELQVTYRDVMSGAGLMEPEGEGRPLLSLQDLESRLVFTRCKPFVLSSPGRQWIFGGDLSRIDGRAVRPFWALLFTDLLLFAKVSRDRVLFITEEPLSLLAVTQAFFNIRKKANEFRLLMDGGIEGTDSPAQGGCGPDLPLSRHPKKGPRKQTITLRAPSAELKAVWQNLIQRQIIYLNTTRGGTPASSPLDSPDPPLTLSVATLDSLSLRRQTPVPTPIPDCNLLNDSQRHLDDLIDHKCRLLGKSGASKGSALHLAQWMRGQLGGATGPLTPEDEPAPDVWSPETLRRRSEQLQAAVRTESRCEEYEMSDTERSMSRSTTDSQVTVRSGGMEQPVSVCRQCHKTCLANTVTSPSMAELEEEDDYDDNWGPLILMGMSALNATVGLGRATTDPFSPSEVPLISVLPPTPETTPRSTDSFQWDDGDLATHCIGSLGSSPDANSQVPEPDTSEYQNTLVGDDDDEDSGGTSLLDGQDPPYQSLCSGGMKRFGTLASLEMLDEQEEAAEDTTDSEGDWNSDLEDETVSPPGGAPQQLEPLSQSLRGWSARAGSFVAEKMALFERLGEDSRAAAFLDRYLRPACDGPPPLRRADSPPDLSSGGGDQDECETSGGTSGDDVWGTPTSGGELDDEHNFPTSKTSDISECDSLSPSVVTDDDAELLMDELLAAPPLSGTVRGFPQRRRLEPLPEEDDTDSLVSPPSSPAMLEKDTPSPEQAGQRVWRCC